MKKTLSLFLLYLLPNIHLICQSLRVDEQTNVWENQLNSNKNIEEKQALELLEKLSSYSLKMLWLDEWLNYQIIKIDMSISNDKFENTSSYLKETQKI